MINTFCALAQGGSAWCAGGLQWCHHFAPLFCNMGRMRSPPVASEQWGVYASETHYFGGFERCRYPKNVEVFGRSSYGVVGGVKFFLPHPLVMNRVDFGAKKTCHLHYLLKDLCQFVGIFLVEGQCKGPKIGPPCALNQFQIFTEGLMAGILQVPHQRIFLSLPLWGWLPRRICFWFHSGDQCHLA